MKIVHSIELDLVGTNAEDEITTIETERAARFAKAGRKPL